MPLVPLRGRSTNLTHEDQFTHHEEYFFAFENCCEMSSVALKEALQSFKNIPNDVMMMSLRLSRIGEIFYCFRCGV